MRIQTRQQERLRFSQPRPLPRALFLSFFDTFSLPSAPDVGHHSLCTAEMGFYKRVDLLLQGPTTLALPHLLRQNGEQRSVPSQCLRFPLSWGWRGRGGAKLSPENPPDPQHSRSPCKLARPDRVPAGAEAQGTCNCSCAQVGFLGRSREPSSTDQN